MNSLKNPQHWATRVFAGSVLPDERLQRRLVTYAAAQAENPASSTAAACGKDLAAREGAYRLLENERVVAEDMWQGPISYTVERCRGQKRILAIQDSSSVAVRSEQLREALQEEGSPTGMMIHTCIAVDPERREPLGILDHTQWIRDPEFERKSTRRKKRKNRYTDKESYKWEAASRRIVQRFEGGEVRVKTVADREADIYEYLAFHQEQDLDFVIRASHSRRVKDTDSCIQFIHDTVAQTAVLGERKVQVPQRGGQKASGGQKGRIARRKEGIVTEVRACQVQVQRPQYVDKTLAETVTVHVVEVRSKKVDPKSGKPSLHWVLLCAEPVETFEQALREIEDYECRWLIEEFFKVCKTGCRLEMRPFQSVEPLERLLVIVLPIAIRILQLRVLQESDDGNEIPCDKVLEDEQWQCLWVGTEQGPWPTTAPSCRWAYYALGKFGAFHDTKGTRRIGWQTLWKGWEKLTERVVGFRLAKKALSQASEM
ncbi:MAG: IS4 family transposase [Rubripirellula sp.]